jgi:hypothetical protein
MSPPIDVVLMNNPPRFSRKYRVKAFVTRIGPSRFVCTIRSICSSVTPSSGPAIP